MTKKRLCFVFEFKNFVYLCSNKKLKVMIYLVMKRETSKGINSDSVVQAYTDYDVAVLNALKHSQNESATYYVTDCELNDEGFMSEPISDEGVIVYAGEDEVAFFHVEAELETVFDGGWNYSTESPSESKRYELTSVKAFGVSLEDISLSDSAKRMINSDVEGIIDKLNDEY